MENEEVGGVEVEAGLETVGEYPWPTRGQFSQANCAHHENMLRANTLATEDTPCFSVLV